MTQIVQTNADEAPKQPDQAPQAAPQPQAAPPQPQAAPAQPATAKYDRRAAMNADAPMRAPDKRGEHQAVAGSPQMVAPQPPVVKIAKAEKQGGRLYITVEGPSIDAVRSLSARTLAYEARFEHGFANAGLEANGPPMPCNDDGTPLGLTTVAPKLYRAVYKLTPG